MKNFLDLKKKSSLTWSQKDKGVAHLLLLGPFYYIQTNFLYLFAHDCKYNAPNSKNRLLLNMGRYYVLQTKSRSLHLKVKPCLVISDFFCVCVLGQKFLPCYFLVSIQNFGYAISVEIE